MHRLDLGIDERVELIERVLDVGGDLEVHRPSVSRHCERERVRRDAFGQMIGIPPDTWMV